MTMTYDRTPRKSAVWRRLYGYAFEAYRILTNRSHRSAAMLRLRKPKNLFQYCNCTEADRYPGLFRLARNILGDGPDVRLLSFGCSTGEEVFTLRKLFPNAWIRGLDINPHNISVCEQRLALASDPKISFELADSVKREAPATYDAIFCMAVFRHSYLDHESYLRCDRLIRFADFCRMIDEIAGRLKAGGLLTITNANFRFRDTPTADEFELVHQMDLPPRPGCWTPIFDRDNRRTDQINCGEVMFRKVCSRDTT
jgi:2-polyprenyl-3-methyl-5-hydroxy-6-metoxy-1,4-benzoquinol methylase